MFCDSDFAGDTTTRKSTTGYAVSLGSGMIAWSSRKQTLTATSTTEAEVYAASEAAKEIIYLNELFKEIDVNLDQPTMLMDNQAAIAIFKTGATHSRTKHYAARIALVHDLTKSYMLKIGYIPTDENIADALTKAIGSIKTLYFAGQLLGSKRGVSIYHKSRKWCILAITVYQGSGTYNAYLFCSVVSKSDCSLYGSLIVSKQVAQIIPVMWLDRDF